MRSTWNGDTCNKACYELWSKMYVGRADIRPIVDANHEATQCCSSNALILTLHRLKVVSLHLPINYHLPGWAAHLSAATPSCLLGCSFICAFPAGSTLRDPIKDNDAN